MRLRNKKQLFKMRPSCLITKYTQYKHYNCLITKYTRVHAIPSFTVFILKGLKLWPLCTNVTLLVSLGGRQSFTKTSKPLMDLKVERKKKHFADFRRCADGGGGGCSDLRGGIKGDVGVALMCELCGMGGALCVCGLCPCCRIVSFSFSPAE